MRQAPAATRRDWASTPRRSWPRSATTRLKSTASSPRAWRDVSKQLPLPCDRGSDASWPSVCARRRAACGLSKAERRILSGVSGDILAQLLVYGLTDGAVVALNAVGFTLAYSVARQINLAHGSVFALTTVVVANVAAFAGITAAAPLPVRIGALLLLTAVGAVCGGLLNVGVERLAFRPFRSVRDPLA